MNVEYTLAAEDYVAFFRYQMKHAPRTMGPSRYLGWLLLACCVLIVAGWIGRRVTEGESLLPSAGDILLIVVLALIAFVYFFSNRLAERSIVRAVRHDPPLQDKRTVSLAPEALSAGTADNVRTFPWNAVARIIEEGDEAFLFVSEKEAIIVPKRAFAEEGQFRAFLDTARQYQEAAGPAATAEGQQ